MFLTPEKAADLLGISPDTVREWARKGRLPSRKFGRLWRFVEFEIRNPEAIFAARERERKNARRNEINGQRRDELRPEIAEYQSWFRASRDRRTPPWADRGAIKAFYRIAQRASDCTGIRFWVDHFIPLHGSTVSGLHTPENLRVISKWQNQSKNNRWESA